jgi:hypothetical protein
MVRVFSVGISIVSVAGGDLSAISCG